MSSNLPVEPIASLFLRCVNAIGLCMNYRHAFHAGNFADVFKHALLTRILLYLLRKPTPIRYIDTHAGIGLYDLTSPQALRSGESKQGIERILTTQFEAPVRELLQPWLDQVHSCADATGKACYPGSPLLAAQLLRPQDRLILCELHKDDRRLLTRHMGRDARLKVIEMDGYMGLKAFVPPMERRGLVLIDPPFEQPDEFEFLAEGFLAAYRRWPTGTYALWYPLKHPSQAHHLAHHLIASGVKRLLRIEMDICAWRAEGPLTGCGFLLVNPPHVLAEESQALLPALTHALAIGEGADWRLEQLAGE